MQVKLAAALAATAILASGCGNKEEQRAQADANAVGFVPPSVTSRLDFGASMERRFRTLLARRGVLFDSVAMNLGRECASPVFIGRSEIQRRKDRYGIDHVHALVYSQQVQFARFLTRRTFLEFVTEPARPSRDRRALITLEVAKILPPQDDSEHWRALARLLEGSPAPGQKVAAMIGMVEHRLDDLAYPQRQGRRF